MDRRAVLGRAFMPLAMAALALPGCDGRGRDAPPVDLAVPPFSPEGLQAKLEQYRLAVAARSPRTLEYLQDGLTQAQITARTAWFPEPLPPEVVALYQWRNGFAAPADSDVQPFQFRDCTFTPLDDVERGYRSMMDTYGREPTATALLAGSFPFAALGGGWLVLPARRQALEPRLERPVISVFQGISVFFHSVERMVETCTAWLSHPKHDGVSLPPRDEMEVWQRVNPGIFTR